MAPPGVNPAYYDSAQAQHYPPPAGAVPGQPQGFAGQPPVHQQAGHFTNQQQAHQHQQVPHQVPHVASHAQHGAPQAGAPLNVANLQQEREHIAEHMEVPLDTSKMSEQELQFHYFKMHDSDNNNKLDGCELIKSLIHWHEQGHENPSVSAAGGTPPQPKLFGDEELVQLIDPILKMDDSNQDGYIDYAEFVRAQQKASTQ